MRHFIQGGAPQMRRRTQGRVLVAAATAVVLVGCAQSPGPAGPSFQPQSPPAASSDTRRSTPPELAPTSSPTPTPTPANEPIEVLIAAGDIAACDEPGDSATAALVREMEGTVVTLGDNVYPAGSDESYAQCYDPVWGGFRGRTHPTMGNHDVREDGGAAYHRYFGKAAGRPGEGWYSYDLGTWHVVALNSNCALVGCSADSAQHRWLVDDLAASNARCTLAYWHHPRFSFGPHGDDPAVAPLWQALHDAGAELLLVGHDHLYERFLPQTAEGVTDSDGIRQFTVGTGGKALYRTERIAPNSELSIDDAFGILVLTLHPRRYGWSFVKADRTEGDSGSSACH